MPLETLFTNPNPTVSRSKSVLSRFVKPLSKRSRNLPEFFIEPETPWKTCSPGDVVKGDVVLVVARGFDLTHLVVSYMVLRGSTSIESSLAKESRRQKFLGTVKEAEGSNIVEMVYKFGFELQFPTKSLPSTIDFERGTISYIISATLTRPITIAPTVSVYKSVLFQDSIEIENIPPAKEQVISLEPISKRGKPRKIRVNPSVAGQGPHRDLPGGPDPPLSPTPSEETAFTATSTSTQSFQMVEHTQNTSTPMLPSLSRRTSDTRSSQTSVSSQTITASASIQRQGALPGDTVAISISVSHVKPNVRGVVIATLYRQGRVDMHPAIPLGSNAKGKKAEYEDIFPRSKTGLGNLYFSNASPNSIFRMDLSQSSTMMVIDPRTLTAEVKTSIRIPDDAFPTIANVPGGMIAFNYYIEIVVDLCGKLGETRFLPRLTSSEPTFTQAAENGNQMTSVWADSILDTAQLRRTRSVVDFSFPVMVGTKDSGRNAGRAREAQELADLRAQGQPGSRDPESGEWDQAGYYENGYNYQYYDNGCEYDGHEGYMTHDEYRPPPAHAIPLPQPEEAVDEKTMLRQYEQYLLPSQPPQDAESSNFRAGYAPSAPTLTSDDILSTPAAAGSSHPGTSINAPSTRSTDTIVPGMGASHEPTAIESLPYQTSGEDKQELERQRLRAQTSAPPTDEDGESPAVGHHYLLDATAPPILDDEDDYTARTLHHDTASDNLPRYKR